MTDNEIKKALECCVGDNDGKNCFDCPLWEIDDCQEQLLLDALDIINHLQAEKQDLEIELQAMRGAANSYKAENERLKSDVSVSRDAYMSMKDRYEYEKEKVEKAKQKCIGIAKALKTAKAEAYKEFAERLKEKYKPYVILGSEVAEIEIDNLLKEIIGE